MEKMTHAKVLEIAMANIGEVTTVFEKLTTPLSAERKPAATQKANEGFKAEELAEDTTVDIIKTVEAVAGFSSRRISAIVKQMLR